MLAGELLYNLNVEGDPVAIVSVWTLIKIVDGVAFYRIADDFKLVHGFGIRDVCTWCKTKPQEAKLLLPRQYC